MERFFADLFDMFRKPKEVFKVSRLFPSRKFFIAVYFLVGLMLCFKRLFAIKGRFEFLTERSIDIFQNYATRAGWYAAAFILPLGVLLLWLLFSFGSDMLAARLGSREGDMRDIMLAYGYIGTWILIFEFITLPLSYCSIVLNMKGIGVFLTILNLIFYIWVYFMAIFAMEVIYGVPMSYATIIVTVVLFLGVMFYSICIDWLPTQIFIPQIMKGYYAQHPPV